MGIELLDGLYARSVVAIDTALRCVALGVVAVAVAAAVVVVVVVTELLARAVLITLCALPVPPISCTASSTTTRSYVSGDHEGATDASREAAARVELRHGSFLTLDFSDADVVYTSSICFEDELMAGVARCARRMRPGALFITLKSFPEAEAPYWQQEAQGWYKMSWGRSSVYCLRRTHVEAGLIIAGGAT